MGTDRVMGAGNGRVWLDRALSLVTAVVVVTALYFLVIERVMPAFRGESVRVVEGGKLPESLEFELLGNVERPSESARVLVPGERGALLLVFSSTCPACYANLPAWRQVIAVVGDASTVLAVGLERDRSAARAYAERHLPAALSVVPEDARRFVGTFGVDIVPFTALVDAGGIVQFVQQGSLDSTAVTSLIRSLGALAESSNP